MLFNVSREKLGRPGRFYNVMMMHWTQFGPAMVGDFCPLTHTMFYMLSMQLASIVKGTAARCTSQGDQVERTGQQNDY